MSTCHSDIFGPHGQLSKCVRHSHTRLAYLKGQPRRNPSPAWCIVVKSRPLKSAKGHNRADETLRWEPRRFRNLDVHAQCVQVQGFKKVVLVSLSTFRHQSWLTNGKAELTIFTVSCRMHLTSFMRKGPEMLVGSVQCALTPFNSKKSPINDLGSTV